MNFSEHYFTEMPYFQDPNGTYIDLKAEDHDNKWVNRFIDIWSQTKNREEQIEMLKSFGATILVFINQIKNLGKFNKNKFLEDLIKEKQLKYKLMKLIPQDMTDNDFQFMKNLSNRK